MNILGISAGFHDAGISFISDDKILFAAHSERYSKVKHDSELNTKILSDCISQFGMPDQIAYYERPWLNAHVNYMLDNIAMHLTSNQCVQH
jgi:carbamoyltransferase